MANGTWRDRARPIIRDVLEETKEMDEKSIRKALHDAYPFGEREYWPYKVWCDEVRAQRGLRRYKWRKKKRNPEPDKRQLPLFEEIENVSQ